MNKEATINPPVTIERRGNVSVPRTHHYPEVRGGICEWCGVMDSRQDSRVQYTLCDHFKNFGLLQCSYCDESKDPNDVIYRHTLNIHDHPYEKDKLLQEKDQKLVNAEKEVDFFKNFSQMTSKYSGANEYQDQIKEKVMAGYDVEDATISILAKEGKFVTPEPAPLPRESPIGGSAVNAMKSGGDKSIGEMTQEERKSALLQAEAEGGEISKILRM